MSMQPTIERFCALYSDLTIPKLSQLGEIYHKDVCFCDPVEQIQGLTHLEAYLKHGLTGVQHCRFEILDIIQQDTQVSIQWNMYLSHPKIKQGASLVTPGVSLLRLEQDRIIFHRDYFDLGKMLYEQLPLLGKVIHHIKRRLSH